MLNEDELEDQELEDDEDDEDDEDLDLDDSLDLDDDEDLVADPIVTDDLDVVEDDDVLLTDDDDEDEDDDGDDDDEDDSGTVAAAPDDESDSTSLDQLLDQRAARRGENPEEETDIMSLVPDRDEIADRLTVRATPIRDRQEFVCSNCHLVKPRVQLADEARMRCRDCV